MILAILLSTVAAPNAGPTLIALEMNRPVVAVRAVFRSGSIDDPTGKEGLTALCAALMVQGGTQKLSASDLIAALFPLAGELDAQVDVEQTAWIGRVHRDNLDAYLPLFVDTLVAPRLDPKEFDRLRQNAIDDIEKRLRNADDENLGKESLSQLLYGWSTPRHPYGHYVGGSVTSLKSITLSDIKTHIARVFTRDRLTLGVSTDRTLVEALDQKLAKLPAVSAPIAHLPLPSAPPARMLIVEKDTASTAVSLGFPYAAKRGDRDGYALMVVASAFGEHRQFNGRLMQQMRGDRGLNYGDYAYIERFIQDGDSTFAAPNIGRRQQLFSIWIRPVEPQQAAFAIRMALYETRNLVDKGLSAAELEDTKLFLDGYSRLWEQTASRRVGYAIDEQFYGTPHFLSGLRERLPTLSLEEVNAALKKWIDPRKFEIAVVTKDTKTFVEQITRGAPTPITYTVEKPAAIIEEDKTIAAFPIDMDKREIKIVRAEDLFER